MANIMKFDVNYSRNADEHPWDLKKASNETYIAT